MKLFALLIFSMELIASVVLAPGSEVIPQSGKFTIEGSAKHGVNLISSLFCEESGEEERETKGEPIIDFVELFSLSELFAQTNFESHQIRITDSVVRYSSQPALFKRICTLVI